MHGRPKVLWDFWAGLGACISADRSCISLCVSESLGRSLWCGFGDPVCGSSYHTAGNMSMLVMGLGMIRNNTPFMETQIEFLDVPNKMYQGSLTTEKRPDRQYDVEFKNVSFKYPGSETYALYHVNMKSHVGSRLAVVGENGSGKSTFIKLLCRLYDPQEGQILLNRIDIRKYRYDDYIKIFSVVFQNFKLVSQSLEANVASTQQYDRKKVEKALLDAGVGDRISAMPDGLDSMLYKSFSDQGVDVSSGETKNCHRKSSLQGCSLHHSG